MTRHPRIAYVVPTMRVGGAELQLIHLMRALQHEFELTLVLTASEGALVGDARRAGAYVRNVAARSGWDFRMEREIRRAFQAHTPHIVHSILFGFDYWAARAARKAGAPVVITTRRELATWKKGRHLWLQRRANALTDCIVANSKAVAEFAVAQEKADPALFRVIANGVDADRFVCTTEPAQLRRRYHLPATGPIVGMVANFSPVKDHELFVAVAERIAARRPDVHFLLVGTGGLMDTVHRRVVRKGLDARFSRQSTVGEIADLLTVMDVFVLTSKIEGFPNAVIEALAAARAVVAPAVGGIPEIVQHGQTGLLIQSRNPDDFAEAIEDLLQHPDKRRALGAAGAEWVRQHLRMESMVDNYRRLYHELLRSKFGAKG